MYLILQNLLFLVSKDLNTSIEEVRDHLKNVIDMMGPHSPKLNTAFETSNDADNEESLYSSTSIISSSVLKVKNISLKLLIIYMNLITFVFRTAKFCSRTDF